MLIGNQQWLPLMKIMDPDQMLIEFSKLMYM
jgi:hypothetical protein